MARSFRVGAFEQLMSELFVVPGVQRDQRLALLTPIRRCMIMAGSRSRSSAASTRSGL
jgi:hypothetical protein